MSITAFHIESKSSPLSYPKRNLHRLLTLLLAFLGYSGALMSSLSLYRPECHMGIVLVIAAIAFCIAALFQFLSRFKGILSLGCLLPVLFYLLLKREDMVVGIAHLINQIYCRAYHTEVLYFSMDELYDPVLCVTKLLCCLVIFLAFFFAAVTIQRPRFLLAFPVSFFLIEPGLYLGLRVAPLAMAPLLAYWCGLLAIQIAGTGRQNQHSSTPTATHHTSICGAATAFLVLTVYCFVVLIGQCIGYTRSEADRQRKIELQQSISNFDWNHFSDSLSSVSAALGMGGSTRRSKLGNRSSLHFSDDTALTLTMTKLPDSAVYLKGFTGSIYENNCWSAAPEEIDAVHAKAIQNVIETYDCVPQNLPFFLNCSMYPNSDWFELTITPETYDARSYLPYAAFSDTAYYFNDADWKPENSDSYSFMVSQTQAHVSSELTKYDLQKEIVPVEYISGGNDKTLDFLQALGVTDSTLTLNTRILIQQAAENPEKIRGKVIPAILLESLLYRDFAADFYAKPVLSEELEEVYASLPEELTQLHPQTAEEQYHALNRIRDWLAAKTDYTTSPGKTPSTRDFVNFFLLENQLGYCVHYAAAGTLLARYLGIPTRYCEGYIVGNDLLRNAEKTNDTYKISVTDRQAHAWCEYYIDGYGWVPFEMTPGYYSTESSSKAEAPIQQTNTPPETAPTTEATNMTTALISSISATSTSATSSIPQVASPQISTQRHASLPQNVSILIYAVLIGMLLIGGYLLLHMAIVRRRTALLQEKTHLKQAVLTAYQYLLQLLCFSGLPYQNQQLMAYCEEAVQHLEQKHLPSQAPTIIIPMALAMDMGKKSPPTADRQEAAQTVLALARSLYQSCGVLSRLRMKYLLHLI